MGLFDIFKKGTKKKTPEERRSISNKKIKSLGIACYENLPLLEDITEVSLKSLDEICKRVRSGRLSFRKRKETV